MSNSAKSSDKERLDGLGKRIAAVKDRDISVAPQVKKDYSQAQLAWRMVTELVAGLLLGLAIGYGLDAIFGTKPILMIVFIGVGFAAGVKTMLRSATELNVPPPPKGETETKDDTNE